MFGSVKEPSWLGSQNDDEEGPSLLQIHLNLDTETDVQYSQQGKASTVTDRLGHTGEAHNIMEGSIRNKILTGV